MEELPHLESGPNPTRKEFLREMAVAKEHEPSAAGRNQSRIEETHAMQERVLANPVYCVKETILFGERKWFDIPANKFHKKDALSTEISKLAMRLERRHDQEEREVDGAVHWDSMGRELRDAFLKRGEEDFSDLVWIKGIS